MIDTNKPYKSGVCKYTGIPIVTKMVPDQVKGFLEILEAVKGSYVEQDKETGIYYFVSPGNRFKIKKEFEAKILECLKEDAITGKLYLCKLSLQTIRTYER